MPIAASDIATLIGAAVLAAVGGEALSVGEFCCLVSTAVRVDHSRRRQPTEVRKLVLRVVHRYHTTMQMRQESN